MKKRSILAVLTMLLVFGTQGARAQGPVPTAMTDGTYGPAGSVTPNSNTGSFENYNAVNQLLGTNYTNNGQIDFMEYAGPDNPSTWEKSAGPSGGYMVIGLGAANSNSLEVYSSTTPGNLINPTGNSYTGETFLGNGSISNPYLGTSSFFSAGDRFGFAVNTVGATAINGTGNASLNWYSDPLYNTDGMDHMMTYHLSALAGKQVYVYDPTTGTENLVTLSDPYLISFEDLSLSGNGINSDMDFNDLMVLVDGAVPDAPLPGTVPEPMTWALLCVGLAGWGVFNFKRLAELL